MRHFILLLLILLLLPFPTLGESASERLAQLDILSQYDDRIQEERYYYMDMYFRIAGCKPAAITNAVTALLASPKTNVPELLVELRNGLLFNRSDKTSAVDLTSLPEYLRSPRDSATELKALLQQVTNVSLMSKEVAEQAPEALLRQFLPNEDSHPLLMRYFRIDEHWPWLIDVAGTLCELGHPDARFALCSVGVGTVDTDGPFGLGQSGHYATLYFVADEFYNNGTFYLLDSYPRALAGEIYGFREQYPVRYIFIEKSKHRFNSMYEPTRVSDTIIRFDLFPKEQELLHATSGADRATQLLRYMSYVVLFSNPYYMLYIP